MTRRKRVELDLIPPYRWRFVSSDGASIIIERDPGGTINLAAGTMFTFDGSPRTYCIAQEALYLGDLAQVELQAPLNDPPAPGTVLRMEDEADSSFKADILDTGKIVHPRRNKRLAKAAIMECETVAGQQLYDPEGNEVPNG